VIVSCFAATLATAVRRPLIDVDWHVAGGLEWRGGKSNSGCFLPGFPVSTSRLCALIRQSAAVIDRTRPILLLISHYETAHSLPKTVVPSLYVQYMHYTWLDNAHLAIDTWLEVILTKIVFTVFHNRASEMTAFCEILRGSKQWWTLASKISRGSGPSNPRRIDALLPMHVDGPPHLY